MPQSLQSIYSFDHEVILLIFLLILLILLILKFSPFFKLEHFCRLWNKITMVSHRIWHTLHLFFNVFLFRSHPVAESPCPSLARTSSTLIQFCQANNYYKTTECTNWSRKTPVRHQEWPHLSIKISSLSAVINIACKLSPVSVLLYLSNLEINVSLMYSK